MSLITQGLLKKSAKGRRALNACAGVSIRNDFTMSACNLIFFPQRSQLRNFGAEIWYLPEQGYENINGFQRHA